MNSKMTLLTKDNYKKLQQYINMIYPNYYISALNLYLWKHYGLEIYYIYESDVIYIYIKIIKDKLIVNDNEINNFYILRPIIKKNEISYPYFIKAIDYIKPFLKGVNALYLDRVFASDLKYLKNYSIVSNSDSSYIYHTNKLKGFPGKKMQKKRNLYNFYNKNYGEDTTFVFYDGTQNREILSYVKNHIIQNQGYLREYEYNYIKNLLYCNDSNLSGLLMYYKNELIGVTIGYSRNDIYEIFLEKASKNYKGSYQYLLSNNLEKNNIEQIYVDRQDSERQEGLEQSKKSYKPYYIVNTYLVKVDFHGIK